ncbi:MAG: hypothetical protein WAK69_10685 [Rhodoplanes sp.]
MYSRLLGTVAFLFSAVTAMAADLSLPQTPIPASAYDPVWGVHIFGGASAGRTRLIELIPMPWSGDYGDNYLIGGDLSRRLGRVYNHFIFEAEVGAGYRFPVNATEGWTALYLRYDGFPWNHILFTTAAINTGLSYVSKVSDVEMDAGADRGNPNGSRLLHYLGPEITLAAPQYRNSELVIRWHHRSGVLGTFDGVWGGSNVVTVGFRQRF